VTVKNIIVEDFEWGIYLYESITNTISFSTFSDNFREGISLRSNSNGNMINDNVVSNTNNHGIYLVQSSNNVLSNNIVTNSHYIGINLNDADETQLIGNTSNQNGDDGISINDDGILVKGNRVENNGFRGIAVGHLSYNTIIEDNTVSNNRIGISFLAKGESKIVRNLIMDNTEIGLQMDGLAQIYNNNFINNLIQANSGPNYSTSTNYSQPPEVGGNYWTDYSPTCTNTNSDHFCDDPYPFSGGTIKVNDDFVWTIQDGWLTEIQCYLQ